MRSNSNLSGLVQHWRVALAFAAGGGLLILLTLGLVWLVQRQPQTSAETVVVLISILTLLVLGFAVGTLGFILRSALARPGANPILLALILAFVLPAVVYFGLDRVLTLRFGGLEQSLSAISLRSPLFPGQPWLFLWQALILAFLGIPGGQNQPRRNDLAATARPPDWLSGLLGGAAIALLGGYLISVTRGWLESTFAVVGMTQPLEVAPLIRWVTLLIGLLVAPWAEERFFRGELIFRWQPRMGTWAAVLASAALFATLQLRPLLWLPAFLAGIGFTWLYQIYGRLKPAVIAHTVVNALLFALGWHWMI
ncbi:MAG: CPBP family intramembrane glutamic endopeptidase [Chloroflexota bacterium]